jgi:hypothetical protein
MQFTPPVEHLAPQLMWGSKDPEGGSIFGHQRLVTSYNHWPGGDWRFLIRRGTLPDIGVATSHVIPPTDDGV